MKGSKNMWVIWVVIAFVVIAGGIYYYSLSGKNSSGTSNTPVTNPWAGTSSPSEAASGTNYEIQITSRSFSPLRLDIKSGDSITFKNVDNSTHWPASVPSPLAGSYPGYDKAKCGTAEESTIFDACKPLQPGESYTFTFTQIGNWGFLDREIPSWTGAIRVN